MHSHMTLLHLPLAVFHINSFSTSVLAFFIIPSIRAHVAHADKCECASINRKMTKTSVFPIPLYFLGSFPTKSYECSKASF